MLVFGVIAERCRFRGGGEGQRIGAVLPLGGTGGIDADVVVRPGIQQQSCDGGGIVRRGERNALADGLVRGDVAGGVLLRPVDGRLERIFRIADVEPVESAAAGREIQLAVVGRIAETDPVGDRGAGIQRAAVAGKDVIGGVQLANPVAGRDRYDPFYLWLSSSSCRLTQRAWRAESPEPIQRP